MAININNNGVKNNSIDTKQTQRQTSTEQSSNSGATAKSGSDSVSLTSEAQNLSALQEKAMNSSGIDQTKVDRIKAAIENGSYKVDVDRLASKLAQFEGDLFGGAIDTDKDA
ncbi:MULTISPECIES: flagellar biosynthesis anti-sigma factor FlgM [unclassified Idiomarina]|jgi:negative regulator of flagellin synthesis FlgM|uniref:flagellar biosynthesis anti-sigma factor FlgM n=1 Tax=unclassified Idiomarina TaxID=2614829 RepID=UPI0008F813E4|nr:MULTISPECIES: flagellar biosynthesis anti-sigma factor FlgM [unclassified Idiomarina]MAD53036.1 flagellar biosynthesis anti-sigma factor FlgM [Idiomarinaceae bacterium]MEC7643394.1 flagellar biosynthesis anti-sigma factor FlgM [Pseudomonadota bacterium]MEC9318643.1 flagellar biosynthesis anti-sigma factor FlgM [Pseudomonadota bacterium]NQZ04596.1 flagellar biosynthesis anti-sigma factor FlgM [Idiomarina sp.]OIM99515.1 flagellar biosynthesis anti-sigma factor FlgM [Idiomarina sp. MD25a]|tara:strand:- start:1399 stop:1734 length:336 start_codon:yes stop_codon:yes gene_type:complete